MKDEATQKAEKFLRSNLAYNKENNILPSKNRIIERLLGRADMAPVYREIYKKLPQQQAGQFLRALIATAAFWNPEKTKNVREQLDRANRLSNEIAEKSAELANLMRMRSDACPDVRKPEDYHPVDVLMKAAEFSEDYRTTHLFRSYVKTPLKRLACQFDMKYWPCTADFLAALAEIQEQTCIAPYDSAMCAAIDSRTHSTADFIRAIVQTIDNAKGGYIPLLPRKFSLSNQSIADFINCAIEPDPPCNAGQVKQRVLAFRRRMGNSSWEIF